MRPTEMMSTVLEITSEDLVSVKCYLASWAGSHGNSFLVTEPMFRIDALKLLELLSTISGLPLILHGGRRLGLAGSAPVVAELALNLPEREVVMVVLHQIVDFKLQHAFALLVAHSRYNTSRLIHAVSIRLSLRAELSFCASSSNLFIKLSAHPAVDRVEVLVGEANLPHGAIWVQEGVVDDD